MRRAATLAVLAGGLLLAGATGVAAQESMVTLTVTVVDGDGERVSGIDLVAEWDGGQAEETTRANGQALVDVPEGAEVSITVDSTDYVRNQPLVVEDAQTGEVEVEVAEAARATVEVVDDSGAVSNPTVQLYRDGDYVVDERAGEDGVLTTDYVESGEYLLRVGKPGYLRNSTRITLEGDVTREVRLERASRLVTVRVRDDHFDPAQPVENATVEMGSYGTVQTVANGRATIEVPVNRAYDVTVTADGYETTSERLRVGESETDLNVTIQRTPALSLSTANQRVVVGESVRATLTDEYGEPVANATVSVDGEEIGETDADGQVDVPVDEGGDHTVSASADGLSAEATVEGVDPDGDGATDEATGTPTDEATETPIVDGTETDTEPSGIAGPGFTAPAALAAVTVVALLLRRRVREP